MDGVGSRGENPQKKAMLDAKRILKDIILKLATESLATFKQKFLAFPLEEQKRILREHGYNKQSKFYSGLHSLQKRFGARTNSNSRQNSKFLEAQNRYFKDETEKRYNKIISTLDADRKIDKTLKKIIEFDDTYNSDSEMVDEPKMKIYEWLTTRNFSFIYSSFDEAEARVIKWAINTYLKDEEEAWRRNFTREVLESRKVMKAAEKAEEAEEEEAFRRQQQEMRNFWETNAKKKAVLEEAKPTEPVEVEEAKPTEPPPNFGPGRSDHESDYGGGSRRKSRRRRRRTRRH